MEGNISELTESETKYVQRDKAPKNISDILENIEQHIGTPIAKSIDDFIREQIVVLFGRIEDDDSLIDESNGRYNREIELRYKIKNLIK